MHYPLSSLSSTGRMLLCLLCAGALLASCETSPTDFGGDPISSEMPLKKIRLDSLEQFVLILPSQQAQGVGIPIPPPPEGTIEITLKTGEGKLTDGERGPRLTLHFASDVPMKPGFDLEQGTGYALKDFSMDLEITPMAADNTPHLAQNHCATNNATLNITRKKYYWEPAEPVTVPIEATIEGLIETTNDQGEKVYEGRLHLFTFYWPDNQQDLFIYDLQATIRIE